MKSSILLLILGGLTCLSTAGVLTSSVWAVLVAGSSGWDNYRHQADICHAYHLLLKNGVHKDRIIVMMYDDIANNSLNENKGVIINEPNGTNVYEGVKIDYRGEDVNVHNFISVLLGNKTAVKGIGTERVLESGSEDHVFINFVDHGGTGVLCFPSENLLAHDFISTLKKMKKREKFGEMVVFIEACESGSMFDGLLGHYDNIIVSTASAPDESSYAWYCDDGPCLGDLYSVSWMERMDKRQFSESLFEQFDAVRTATLEKSHVNLYGDYRLGFIEFGGSSEKKTLTHPLDEERTLVTEGKGVDSRDVPIHMLQEKIESLKTLLRIGNANPQLKEDLLTKQQELETLKKGRETADNIISKILLTFVNGNDKLKAEIESTRLALNENMMDCYKNIITEFDTSCFKISKNYYFLRHLYKFANICLKQMDELKLIQVIQTTCEGVTNEKDII